MERNLTEKEKEQLLNMGAFEYDAQMCASILGFEIKDVESLMKNPESEFYKTYKTGQIRAQYVIDLKLFEQAQGGDIKALDKLKNRQMARKAKKI
jgi:hypothetical protein